MPKKKEGGSKRKRTPNIKVKLVRELVAKRKEAKRKLREIERDLRSLRPKKRKTE